MIILRLVLVLLFCLVVFGKKSNNQKHETDKFTDRYKQTTDKHATQGNQPNQKVNQKRNTQEAAKSSVFDSSSSNRQKAKENYPHDPVQRKVATVLGDELPLMRDDLIKRKNAGEGAVERHVNAWKNKENWKWHGDEQDRRKKEDNIKK